MKKLTLITALICAVLFGTMCLFSQSGSKSDANARVYVELNSYDKIAVSHGLKLVISEDVKDVVVYATPEALAEVSISVVDAELRIGIRSRVNPTRRKIQDKIVVHVPVKEYSSIRCSMGSSVSMDNVLKTKSLSVSSSSGSSIRGMVECSDLKGSASSGSSIKLSGTAADVILSTSSGASISCENLVSETATGTAASGSTISMNASREANGTASSGGSVINAGAGEYKKISKSSGGSVRKK